jgi:hypothetical protein
MIKGALASDRDVQNLHMIYGETVQTVQIVQAVRILP